jgi:hypothetical protein
MSAVGKPDRYLGANIKRVTIPGDQCGMEYWSMTSQSYVRNAVNNVREMPQSKGYDLKTTAKTPFPSNYRPELDVSDKLDEVSVLSQYLTSPRVGHLETVYHLFAYLHKHDKSSIVFDPSDPIFDPTAFIRQDWSEFYGDVEEEMPPKMPEPLGSPVTISVFVDANHAGNIVTRRSHTGVLAIHS